jgi:hypothetical protein
VEIFANKLTQIQEERQKLKEDQKKLENLALIKKK